MNKAQFIDQVADKAQLSKAAAQRAVDAIFDTAGGAISETVHSLGELSIPGFGKFTKKTRAARTGRNPRTGAEIQIPERSSIGFTAGKNLREGTISGRRKAAGAVAGAALGAAAGAAAATAGAPKKGGVNSGAAASTASTGTAASGGKSSGGAKSGGAAKSGGSAAAKGKPGGGKGGSAAS